ncbi:MAG: hypothetical protein IT436_03010 [Phycisphaerales bacterium]|nr:hypothetical protein [Phycisphaerales bacterium]
MKCLLSCFAAALICTRAGAAIIGVSGGVTLLPTPPAGPTSLLSPPFAFAWDEQQNISVTSLSMDMGAGPWVAPPAAPTTYTGLISSHMIHWTTDHSGISASGSVQFNGPIIGVIFDGTRLAMSDPVCGLPPTVYLSGHPGRLLDIGSTVRILPGTLDTLHFDFISSSPAHEFTEVRVITAVPAPGAMALLGAGGLVAARRLRR